MADQDYATVSGTKVHRSDFAYAPAGSSPSEWKLPIQDAAHIRNALARYNQTDLPADAKPDVYRKILEAARKFGIEVSTSEINNQQSPIINLMSSALRLTLTAPIAFQGKQLYQVTLCVSGKWVKSGKEFFITSEDLMTIGHNFEKRKNEQVVIDYEHASEMPEVARGGPVPAAGWIHSLSANGVLKGLVEWTPEAERMIREGQYRFFSPAIDWGAKDKETGEPQGATLTSGALTNHPFLEELPAITLSDKDSVFSSQFSVLRKTNPEGGKKVPKIKLMKKGAGKRSVMQDEVELGEIALDDLDLDDEELNAIAGKRGYKKMQDEEVTASAVLREAGIAGEDLKSAIATHRSQTKRTLLAETVKEGKIDLDHAAGLADAQKIGFADYRAAQRASEALEEAVKAGKILPRDRDFFARVALSDPEKFAAWSKQAPAVINLTTVGIGGAAASDNPAEEMHARVKQVMGDKNMNYLDATRFLASTEPELVRRYRSAIGKG